MSDEITPSTSETNSINSAYSMIVLALTPRTTETTHGLNQAILGFLRAGSPSTSEPCGSSTIVVETAPFSLPAISVCKAVRTAA